MEEIWSLSLLEYNYVLVFEHQTCPYFLHLLYAETPRPDHDKLWRVLCNNSVQKLVLSGIPARFNPFNGKQGVLRHPQRPIQTSEEKPKTHASHLSAFDLITESVHVFKKKVLQADSEYPKAYIETYGVECLTGGFYLGHTWFFGYFLSAFTLIIQIKFKGPSQWETIYRYL